MKEIIDLTLPVESGMPTCGTPWHQTVELTQMGLIEDVGRNTSRIVLGSHSGTHIDAPKHFIDDGITIDRLDLNTLCGPITIVDLDKQAGEIIEKEDLLNVNVTERLLFRHRWYQHWKSDSYYKDYPFFSLDAAKYLVEQGVKLIAMDTPSPDSFNGIREMDDSPVHKLLLREHIVIIEYLNNTDLIQTNKEYEIIALPLRAFGLDGCPARVILREL